MNRRFFSAIFLIFFVWGTVDAQILQKSIVKNVSPEEQIVLPFETEFGNFYVLKTARSFRIEREDGVVLLNKTYDRSLKVILSGAEDKIAVQIYDSRQGDQFRLEVYTVSGQKLFETEMNLYQDDLLPVVAVANSGELALIRPETNALVLFSAQGDTLFAGTVGSEVVPAPEKMAKACFSDDGRFLAVLGMRRPATLDTTSRKWRSAEPLLSLFSAAGQLLWQKQLPGTLPQTLALSPTGNWIAASTVELSDESGHPEHHFSLITKTGSVKFSDSFSVDKALFSPDEQAMIRYSRKAVQFLNLNNFARLSEWKASPLDGVVCDLGVNWEKKEFVALLGKIVPAQSGYRIERSKLLWKSWAEKRSIVIDFSESLNYPAHFRLHKPSGTWFLQTPQAIQKITILR